MADPERLWEKLGAYAKENAAAFHMPGHKRNTAGREGLPGWLREMMARDITEITGFDDLRHPEGLIRDLQEELSDLFGSEKTFISVGGSSLGNLSCIHAAVPVGGTLVVAGEPHVSILNAITVGGRKGVFVPAETTASGIQGSVDPEAVRDALDRHPEADAVVVTSPSYEGVVSDIRSIAGTVHEKGLPLLVDEAHGAHLKFCPGFPESALSLGADLVVQSLHKTLPAPTQTAVVHLAGGRFSAGYLEKCIQCYQTTSPSYLLMGGISWCAGYLEEHREDFSRYADRVRTLRRRIEAIRSGLCMELSEDPAVFAADPGKLVLSAEKTGLTGKELLDVLSVRYGIECEKAEASYVIAMTSVWDTENDHERLLKALEDLSDR